MYCPNYSCASSTVRAIHTCCLVAVEFNRHACNVLQSDAQRNGLVNVMYISAGFCGKQKRLL
jgi:hypothetical protein